MYVYVLCREHLELEKLQVTHTKTVARLEGKVSELLDELDGASRSYDTLKEKLERQELLLSEWKEKANNKSNTSYLEVEMGSLQSTVAQLERENDELLVKVCVVRTLTPGLSNAPLSGELHLSIFCCKSPSPSCMLCTIFPGLPTTPGLPNTWFIQHLVYPTPGLPSTWFIQHLVHPTPGLSNTWFIQHLVYPAPGLSNTWFTQHLVYPIHLWETDVVAE